MRHLRLHGQTDSVAADQLDGGGARESNATLQLNNLDLHIMHWTKVIALPQNKNKMGIKIKHCIKSRT